MTAEVVPLNDRPHMLYRFLDDGGALLYVGITANPGQRWAAHATDKPWWPQVRSIDLEHHATRQSALDAEARAIRAETPAHNVQRPGLMVMRSFRISPVLWRDARAKAEREGVHLSDVVRDRLAAWVEAHATEDDPAAE